jgi:hypothetical protein
MHDTDSMPADSDNDIPQKQPATGLTIGLFAVLAGWILSIAIGTIVYREDPDSGANWGKLLIVVLPMTLFLSLWAGLLMLKRKSSPRNSGSQN